MSQNELVYPIILSGGSGTRLWPLSRPTMPKQFTKIFDQLSLFQKTILRVNGFFFADPIVVTGNLSRFIVRDQLEKINIKPSGVIIEPKPFDTAPAALSGIIFAFDIANDPIVLLCPADHWIENNNYFKNIIKDIIKYVDQEKIFTFGIKPKTPHTGYGWITTKKEQVKGEIYKVKKFIEKPKLKIAESLIQESSNFWNSGIFMGKASAFINAYKRYSAYILKTVENSYSNSYKDLNFIRLNEKKWNQLNKISIDHAIIEKHSEIYMKPFDEHWSDIGSFDSLMKHYQGGTKKNIILGNSSLFDSKNTLLNSTDEKVHLVGVGLDNITAIATKDAILCINNKKSENVRDVVNKLIENKIEQAKKSLYEYRPWGTFEILSSGKNFQVKKIQVFPNSKLSLQSHKYRSEHWVVVKGTATVTIGNENKIISENESVYINSGEKHRLENQTKEIITIIEVQTGSYLGEDDIVRYDDDYNRLNSE